MRNEPRYLFPAIHRSDPQSIGRCRHFLNRWGRRAGGSRWKRLNEGRCRFDTGLKPGANGRGRENMTPRCENKRGQVAGRRPLAGRETRCQAEAIR